MTGALIRVAVAFLLLQVGAAALGYGVEAAPGVASRSASSSSPSCPC